MQPTSNLTQEQLDQLAAWKASALLRMPYMAAMLFSLRPVSAPDLGTLAVDKHHRLYIDFEAMSKKSPGYCAEGLLHECCHLLGDHADRADDFGITAEKRRQWNFATDLAINDDLRDAGCAELAEYCLLPKQFDLEDDLTAEAYMRALDGLVPPGGDGSGCGSGSGGQPLPGEAPSDSPSGDIGRGASATEAERTRISTAAHIRQHAAKHPGNTPGGLVDLADEILAPPSVPWRQVLSSFMRRYAAIRSGDTDTTYLRRRRRSPSITLTSGARVIMPGTVSPTLSLVVVRDTSSSMGADEIAATMSEIEGIARQIGVNGKDLIVLDVDTEVAANRRYYRPSSISEVHGRGGTDMGAGIAAAVGLKPRPLAIVVITDGETPWPPSRPAVPVIACLVGDDAEDVASRVPEWAAKVIAT